MVGSSGAVSFPLRVVTPILKMFPGLWEVGTALLSWGSSLREKVIGSERDWAGRYI